MRARLSLLLLLALGCGKAKPDPNAPVAIQPANLAGYWYAPDPDHPVLLHFGAPLIELPGEAQTAESTFFGNTPTAGSYVLAGSKLNLKSLAGEAGFEGTITRLTQDALDVQPSAFQATPLHFRRMAGCGGPGLWMGAQGRPVAAAWGDDGSLHLLSASSAGIIGSETGQYSVVPPGRCAPVTPSEPLTGNAIDVAPDGAVRILDANTTGLFLRELPAQPWARDALNVKNTRLLDGDRSAIRPPAVVARLADGRTLLAWAHSGSALYTWLSDGAGGYHAELVGSETPTLTPQRLVWWPQPGGGVRVGPDFHSGWAYDGHAWTPVLDQRDPVVGLPDAERYGPDGLLYAAWSDATSGHYPSIVVGRRRADGTWQTVDVGQGLPVDLRVRPDGTVDVAFYYQPGKAAMGLLSVPPSFEALAYTQSYGVADAIYNGFINIYDDGTNIYPFAAFGPEGAVLVSANEGGWRQPKFDAPSPHRPWVKTHIDFTGDAPATLTFPTLGLSCTATCDLLLPTREVVPAKVTTAESALPGWISPYDLLVGGTPLGQGVYAVLTQHDPVTDHHDTYGTLTLAVHSFARHLSPVVPLADAGLQVQLQALAPTPSGGLLAWVEKTGEAAQLVELDAQLRVTQRRTVDSVTSPSQGVGQVLHARAGGGAVLWVAAFGGHGGSLLFMDAALGLSSTQNLEGQDVAALADDGAWVLRTVDLPPPTGGSRVDLVKVTAAGEGAPVHTELLTPDRAAVLGDGLLVSLKPISGGQVLGGITLYEGVSYLFRIGADGAIRWGMPQGSATWTTVGDDLAVLVQYGGGNGPLTFRGQTFPEVMRDGAPAAVSDLAAKLDGATGAIKQARTGVFPFGPTAPLASDDQGVTTLVTTPSSLNVVHVPFDAAQPPRSGTYLSSVQGHCTDVLCRGGPAMVVPHDGAWILGWNQGFPLTYDGFQVDGVGVPLLGLWRP